MLVIKMSKILKIIIGIIGSLCFIISNYYNLFEFINSGRRIEVWRFIFIILGSVGFLFLLFALIFEFFKEIKKKHKEN